MLELVQRQTTNKSLPAQTSEDVRLTVQLQQVHTE